MTAWRAFTGKEFLEAVRTGKLALLLLVFLMLGIMNPAVAKLTPWLIESMAESMEETGLSVAATEVNAMSSWVQFYKNAPMALIIFALMFGGILTGEYQRGTLINIVTKGLARWKILAAKALALLAFWTGGYWLMFGLTWGYTVYFWDSVGIFHPVFGAFCVYLLGIWLISLLLLGSGIFRSGAAVLGMAGAGFVLSYLLGLIPAVRDFVPTRLLEASVLLTGAAAPEDFLFAAAAAGLLVIGNLLVAVVCFDQRPLS
ncbi:MAG: ABC transporter permease subunit [Lachnospiraceae bacterium]|nr:ABC transporter permease subunit [Lachnospiraceae bacterium]